MATSHRTVGHSGSDEHLIQMDIPKRIAWGAVFAGALLALMAMMLINLLFLGFGFMSINPTEEQNPFAGLGTGSVIGLVVSNLIALFIGGWVAGRLANKPRATDSVLHGLLTWSVLTVVSFMLLSSAVGTLVSGMTSVVGKGLSLAGEGVAAVAPEAAQAVEEALQGQGIALSDIRQEARQILEQVDDNSRMQPGGLERQAEQAAQNVQETTGDIARNPQQAGQEIEQLIDQLFSGGGLGDLAESANRDDLVEALVTRTSMSQAEAEQTVNNWIQVYQNAQQALAKAEQNLRQAGEQAAEVLSAASFWALVGLIVGAVVAAIGSWVGKPKSVDRARAA